MPCTKGGNSSVKRQRAKQRPLYRYDVYRGRRRGQVRLLAAGVCAVLGLLLVLIRGLGIRFSGFLLLGAAALLALSWLLDRLAAGDDRWRLVRRGFYGCVAEAEDGFYLLLRKPVDLSAVAPDYFDALLQAAADSAEISTTRALENLDVSSFYEALTEARAEQASAGGEAA